MEYLTKTQVILLAILVSFVSSVATGIVTISLLGQAPPTVAAGVNRIIEKTVQQVIMGTTTPAAPQSIKPATLVPSDAPAAIIIAQKSIIRIVEKGDATDKLVARGIVVSAKGSAVTDAGSLNPDLPYDVILPGGARVPVVSINATSTSPIAYITFQQEVSTILVPATIADSRKLQLGTSVIRIGGFGNDTVALGIAEQLPDKSTADTIEADVASGVPGAALINLYGEIIGITTQDSLTLGQNYYTVLNTK